jgi:hypothetical protein
MPPATAGWQQWAGEPQSQIAIHRTVSRLFFFLLSPFDETTTELHLHAEKLTETVLHLNLGHFVGFFLFCAVLFCFYYYDWNFIAFELGDLYIYIFFIFLNFSFFIFIFYFLFSILSCLSNVCSAYCWLVHYLSLFIPLKLFCCLFCFFYLFICFSLFL